MAYKKRRKKSRKKYKIMKGGSLAGRFFRFLAGENNSDRLRLNELKDICSTNELAGEWVVKFIGTEYPDINLKILNQTSSWDTRTFDPVC